MEIHITLSQARAGLSAVVERAAAGENFIVTKRGKPTVKITPIEQKKKAALLVAMKDHDFKMRNDVSF